MHEIPVLMPNIEPTRPTIRDGDWCIVHALTSACVFEVKHFNICIEMHKPRLLHNRRRPMRRTTCARTSPLKLTTIVATCVNPATNWLAWNFPLRHAQLFAMKIRGVMVERPIRDPRLRWNRELLWRKPAHIDNALCTNEIIWPKRNTALRQPKPHAIHIPFETLQQ